MAIKYLKIATELSPESERASRGLFISLAKAGRDAEAWDEAERLLCVVGYYPDEYDLMLKEASGEISDTEYDKRAAKIDRSKIKKNKL